MRSFPRLAVIGAFLAAAALLLGFSAPAHADGAVFVSNIEEDSDNVFNLHALDIAQGFVAGSADVPGSIEVDIAAAVDTDTSTVTVQLFSATAGGATKRFGMHPEHSEPLGRVWNPEIRSRRR